jgi:hypothetical protein
MNISDEQKKEFLVLIGQAFMEIRSLSRKPITDEKRVKIFDLADRFHNIPSLISEADVDYSRLICEINIQNDSYRETALNIIKKPLTII